jgi:hypothetical protein
MAVERLLKNPIGALKPAGKWVSNSEPGGKTAGSEKPERWIRRGLERAENKSGRTLCTLDNYFNGKKLFPG